MQKLFIYYCIFFFSLTNAYSLDKKTSEQFSYCFAIILGQNGGAKGLREDYNKKKYDLTVNYDSLLTKGDEEIQYQNFLKSINEQDKIFVKDYLSFVLKGNLNHKTQNEFYINSFENSGCYNLIKIKNKNYNFKNSKLANYAKPVAINSSNNNINQNGLNDFERWYSIIGLLLIFVPPLLLLMISRGRGYLDTPENVKHVGFWVRLLASGIDLLLFTFLSYAIIFIIVFATSGELDQGNLKNLQQGQFGSYVEVAFILSYLLYAGIMQSSKFQATFGMMVFRFKLCDHKFQKVRFFRVVLRELATYFSALIFCVGFLMIAFTKKKQALHDKISKTFCVKYPIGFNPEQINDTNQDEEKNEEEDEDKPGSKFVSFLVSILSIPIFLLGSFAANYTIDKFFTQYESVIMPMLESTGFYDWIYHLSKNIFVGVVATSFYVGGIKLLYKKTTRGAASIPILIYFTVMASVTILVFFSDYISEFIEIPNNLIDKIKVSDVSIEELIGEVSYFTAVFFSFFLIFKKKKVDKKDDE